jgi:hypothetical protein
VEWVDAASSPFYLGQTAEGNTADYGNGNGVAHTSLASLLSLTGVKASTEVVSMAMTNHNHTNTNEQQSSSSSGHSHTQGSTANTNTNINNNGTALLCRARACASLKSAVEVVGTMYAGLSAKNAEQRIARQLMSQVNSKEVKDLLASAKEAQQQQQALIQTAATDTTSSGTTDATAPTPSMSNTTDTSEDDTAWKTTTNTTTSSSYSASAHPPGSIMTLTQNLSVTRKAADGYDVFVQRLRSPEAAELVQGMKYFVTSLERTIQLHVNEITSKAECQQANNAKVGGGGGANGSTATSGHSFLPLQRAGSMNKQKLVQGLTQFVASSWDSNKRGVAGGSSTEPEIRLYDSSVSEPPPEHTNNTVRNVEKNKNPSLHRQQHPPPPEKDLFSLHKKEEYSSVCHEAASSIQSFVQKHTASLKTHLLWQNDSPDEFELQAKIAMETFLFQKFHQTLWDLTEDGASDEEMADQLESLQFITWKHLDIKCLLSNNAAMSNNASLPVVPPKCTTVAGEENEASSSSNTKDEPTTDTKTDTDTNVHVNAVEAAKQQQQQQHPSSDKALERMIPVPSDQWSIPVNALRFLNAQWSPTSKLVLIMKAYRGVSAALCTAMPPGELPGADDTLPTLILALLHAQPIHIVSNLAFIQSFARPDLLRGEPGYVLTSLISALQFLRELKDASSLTICPDAFAEGLRQCQASLKAKRGKTTTNNTNMNSSSGGASIRSKLDEYNDEEETSDYLAEDNDGTDKASSSRRRPVSVLELRQARLNGEEVCLEWAAKWQQDRAAAAGLSSDNPLVLHSPGSTGSMGGAFLTTKTKKSQSSDSFGSMLSASAGGGNGGIGIGNGSTHTHTPRNYSYLGVPPEDVRVVDVPILLEEYHELVRFCESLLNTRNSELVAEQKRQKKALRDKLERSAAAANLELRG